MENSFFLLQISDGYLIVTKNYFCRHVNTIITGIRNICSLKLLNFNFQTSAMRDRNFISTFGAV